MTKSIFSGTGVALVTPFKSNLEIDFEALGRLTKHVVAGKVDYIVLNGTTGESPTVKSEEKWQILAHVRSLTELPIMLGFGGNCTEELLADISNLGELSIQGILSVTPYYNRPSQKGLYNHFKAIADQCPVPVMLYNVPFRTAVNLESETTLALAAHPNIIGIKEASGQIEQIKEIIQKRPKEFIVLSGDDAMTLPIIEAGGEGVISVIANYKPVEFTEMVNAAMEGKSEYAQSIDSSLRPIYHLLSLEGNPSSIKTALEASGIIDRYVRLPLDKGSDELLNTFKKYT